MADIRPSDFTEKTTLDGTERVWIVGEQYVTSRRVAGMGGGGVDATVFGVDPSSTSNQLPALQAALDSGERVYLPPHESSGYRIDGPLDARGGGAKLFGAGRGLPGKIIQLDKSSPILMVGGMANQFVGLQLAYEDTVLTSDLDANAIEFYRCVMSEFRSLYLYNVGRGFYIPQEDVGGFGNSQWSNVFDTIEVSAHALEAIRLVAFSSGQTPSTWRNIYLNGKDTTGTVADHDYVMYLGNDDGQVFTELNIEWNRWSSAAILLSGCHATEITRLNFEQNQHDAWNGGVVHVGGDSMLRIGSVSYRYGEMLQPGNLFRVTSTAQVYAGAIFEDTTTLNGNAFNLLINERSPTAGAFSRGHLINIDSLTDNGPAPYATTA